MEYLKQREAVDRQAAELMPVIEQERCVFIHAEYGRLQSLIGTAYWDKAAKESRIFRGREGDDLSMLEEDKKDPRDITIEELLWITAQVKCIERCGTNSYMNFFNIMPDDRERLQLLAGLWHRITHEELCTAEEIRALKDGHAEFIQRKLGSTVTVTR